MNQNKLYIIVHNGKAYLADNEDKCKDFVKNNKDSVYKVAYSKPGACIFLAQNGIKIDDRRLLIYGKGPDEFF